MSAPVPWPPSRGLAADAPLGERVYRWRCATSHGLDANGNGPAAPSMIPRPLHWQAMIWDHASNWDEEDVRALVAYLRTLPPVRRAIPATRDPASDDCAIYTFWIKPHTAPGCR